MSNQTIRTDATAKVITAKLAAGLSVSAACRAAKIARASYYLWIAEDDEFAARVQDAIEEGTDKLEDSAVRQALQGNTSLMALLLKARRREMYGDRQQLEHTGKDGAPLTVVIAERADGPA